MRHAIEIAVGLAVLLAIPLTCSAQAWLPPKGEGVVSGSFQRVEADGHFLEDGSKLEGYRTRASNFVLQATYGITDQLALALTVPFVNVKYLGPEEPLNLPLNVLDNGAYHGTLTDLRFELRYNALQRPVVITPFAAGLIPSHSYDTLGESAPGRNFQEFPVGVYVGRLLDPVLPRAFVQGSYAYAFVRQDVGIDLNYSVFGVDAGYFVTPSVSVSVLWRGLKTHGGLSFNELWEAPPDVFVNMDRVVRASYHHLGVGLSVPLGGTASAFANYVWFVDGVDAHYGGSFSIGLSWGFRTRFADRPPFPWDLEQ
jgi:hypothetical protein